MSIKVIITAGGTSNRFGKSNKLMEKIAGKTIIEHTVSAFLAVEEVCEIVLCANISIIDELKGFFAKNEIVKVIEGGQTRQESVFNGLKACADCDFVLIHDGARPLVSPEIIRKAILSVKEKKALTVAAKTTDTIKQVDENLKIIKTVDRTNLYNTQTPQAFDYSLILAAHQKLAGSNFTDDAGMLESLGEDVYILEGDYKNIKITTQSDLQIAENYLKK